MPSGSPAVLLNPDTCSRILEYVYAALQLNAFTVRTMGERRTVSCAVFECRSDRSSDTRVNDCDFRPPLAAMKPVVGTMLAVSTNTGRPSSARLNCVAGLKLMSTVRCWLRLTEYVPSILVEKRASRMLPFHDRLERTVRCGRNALDTRYTFGAVVAKTLPVVPSVHWSGIGAVFDAYSPHSGVGAA